MGDQDANIRPGMLVGDIGYQRVGIVGAVSAGVFEVRLDGGPSLWLSTEAVFLVNASVTLVCEFANVWRYQRPGPTA